MSRTVKLTWNGISADVELSEQDLVDAAKLGATAEKYAELVWSSKVLEIVYNDAMGAGLTIADWMQAVFARKVVHQDDEHFDPREDLKLHAQGLATVLADYRKSGGEIWINADDGRLEDNGKGDLALYHLLDKREQNTRALLDAENTSIVEAPQLNGYHGDPGPPCKPLPANGYRSDCGAPRKPLPASKGLSKQQRQILLTLASGPLTWGQIVTELYGFQPTYKRVNCSGEEFDRKALGRPFAVAAASVTRALTRLRMRGLVVDEQAFHRTSLFGSTYAPFWRLTDGGRVAAGAVAP